MSANEVLSSWFSKLRMIPNIAETTEYEAHLDEKYGYLITISRYICPYGEYSDGFHNELSIYHPVNLSSDTDGFKTLYVMIPHDTQLMSFLPNSTEYDALLKCPLGFTMEKIVQKIVTSYSHEDINVISKTRLALWDEVSNSAYPFEKNETVLD